MEQQRLISDGTNQRLDFDSVASALATQYPEYKAAPPAVYRDGTGPDGNPQRFNKRPWTPANTSSNSTPSSGTTNTSGNPHYNNHRGGKGNFTRRVFQTTKEEQNIDEDGGLDEIKIDDERMQTIEEADEDPDGGIQDTEDAGH